MRVFILIALLAMAATVSAQSAACNSSIAAIDANTTITALTPVGAGCTELTFDDTQCSSTDGLVFNCLCATTYANASAWESAVTGAGGRACYLGYEFSLTGAALVGNVSKQVVLNGSHTGALNLAIGGACNDTDFQTVFGSFVTKAAKMLTDTAASVKKGNATWTSGSVTVSACAFKTTVTQTFGGSSTGTTTAPPTATSSSSSTGTNGNTTSTTAPPTVNPSSTGKGSGASIIASSAALVASLIAAVTILA